MQLKRDVAPCIPLNVPAGQPWQSTEPVRLAYEPLAHLVHTEALAAPMEEEKWPSGHGMQNNSEDAPTVVEYVPAGHGMHCVSNVSPVALE